MSIIEAPIDIDTVIPDGIQPVEAFRCWGFANGTLMSLNGTFWKPGVAHEAKCIHGSAATYSWNVVRRGMSRTQAEEFASHRNQFRGYFATGAFPGRAWIPNPPSVEPPDGYGFDLVTETHDAPDETCTCGIYAATAEAQVPASGVVYGTVKLWGKVIPGETGTRAQFAYPSEFHVPANLIDDPVLKAFGVPMIAKKDLPSAGGGSMSAIPITFNSLSSGRPRLSRGLKFSIAANVAACALNLSLVGLQLVH